MLFFLAICTKSNNAKRLGRMLDQDRVDEDDEFGNYDDSVLDDDTDWWQLEHYVQRNTLMYDTIEAFLYIADLFFIVWLTWGCLVHIGVLPDDRLDRQKDRRVHDGRGVFSPVRNFDPFESSDDDDNGSIESMEYGNNHLGDNHSDVNIEEEEKKLDASAEDYFNRPDRQRKEARNQSSIADKEQLLDLELTVQKNPGAQTIFI